MIKKTNKMKKLILTSALLLTITAALFAGPRKNSTLLSSLNSAMSGAQLKWQERGTYSQANLNIQGKTYSVFKDENGIIGFSVHYLPGEVPAELTSLITAKYPGVKILEAAHFIKISGEETDFVMVQPKKALLVYEIKNGKARYFGKA